MANAAPRAVVFLADGFEEIECITVIDVVRRADVEVKTVSIHQQTVKGAHAINIEADALAADYGPPETGAEALLEKERPAVIFLPGGQPGADNLRDSQLVQAVLKLAAGQGLVTAAICAAPIALGRAGLLEGRRFTCYPGYEQGLGGQKEEAAVVSDGTVVTGNGPGAAFDFALELVNRLKGADTARDLAQKMQYSRT